MQCDNLFHFSDSYRQRMLNAHNFYVEQAKKRLLSQFQNIEKEADSYGEQYLDDAGKFFDPDRHDPSDIYEQAHDELCEFYHLLEEMQKNTLFSVIAGMYHEWDKQFRMWLTLQVSLWHSGNKLPEEIWSSSFQKIIELASTLGWIENQSTSIKSLELCSLIVNVYKHGNGISFNSIIEKHPYLLPTKSPELNKFYAHFKRKPDYTELGITEEHLEKFSAAIISFWKSIPEDTFNNDKLNFPDWFVKAHNKDCEEAKTSASPL